MFKEILKVVPKIESSDLGAMETALNSRFMRISKKFGKGLLGVLTGGGVAGVALGIVDKLLNPLKETQDAIDKTLKQGDDIVTNAKQFGTTAGRLFKLQQLAKSTGLDESSLNILLEKFQTKIAEAAADPSKQTSVRQFVGQKDIAQAFFDFIQGMQKMEKNAQVLVQQEVFGEKLILKMADLLQTDLTNQIKLIGAGTGDQYTPALEKVGALNDLKDALEAKRALQDVVEKAKNINEGVIQSMAAQEQRKLDLENKQIASYDSLASIEEASGLLMESVKEGVLSLTSMAVKMSNLSENVRKLTESRFIRGILGSKDK